MITPLDYALCVSQSEANLEERCLWIVTLSDGTVIYQNDQADYLPPEVAGIEHSHSSWVRLRAYLMNTKLNIVHWKLQFRKRNIVPLQPGIGFVYARGLIGGMKIGPKKDAQGNNPQRFSTQYYHIVGTILNPAQHVVERAWYHAPSLTHRETKTSLIAELDPAMIIWNKTT